ncbi:AAA family ATPase [Methanosarcina barkeri]|uniref:DNA double-strand break repair Rad50 ATPase n=1 Tax=Methanosarcina barkeri 227 TaxID=1434106 RepID=A0A0E3R2Y2_METBA|nr:AAA family ATPase [Methanosarcina barkeri]AKB57974.1 DNA double-strand break repair Rad50 ATPase [Methanosarcina barkeri 227]
MIIKNIKLNPFGGLADKELNLDKGLNVICGPNEAGKSTIYNGIQKVLFLPSNLRKNGKQYKEIQKYIPIGGGDTAKVEMQFLHEGNVFTLRRMWGGSNTSELKLPDGTLLTEESSIQKQLELLLVAKEGTYRSILMTYQNGLSKTLEDLINNQDTVYSLGDIIRKTMHETDGVSVDEFRKEIDFLYNDYFEHWDRELKRPQNGKELENRYRNGVGRILKAYYEKEEIDREFVKAQKYEEKISDINQKISDCNNMILEKREYVEKNKKVVEDAQTRKIFDANKESLNLSIKNLSEVNRNWPVLENKIKELNEQISKNKEKLEELNKEKKLADLQEKNKKLIEQAERVNNFKKEQEEAENALRSVKKLTEDDFEKIREKLSKLNTLKTKLTAGKLKVQFEARKDVTISIQKDLEKEYSKELFENEIEAFEAGGKLKLEHPNWVIEVSSGEDNIEQLISECIATEKEFKDFLTGYQADSIEEARIIYKKYQALKIAFDKKNDALTRELGEELSYAEFCKKIEKLGPIQETRVLVQIISDVKELENEINNADKELKQYQTQIEKYKKEYGTEEELLLSYSSKIYQRKELEEKEQKLSPLPEGIEVPDIFIEEYKKEEDKLNSAKDKKEELREEWFEIERNAPNESSEELMKKRMDFEAELHSTLRRGEAIARIRDLSIKIQEEMDSSIYSDLKKVIEGQISTLTDSRYTAVKMEESIPRGFIRNDGEILDYELLSAGTKDALSLALRISMAKYFLKEAEGFLIMDDPFVDMDPERQQRAGEIIRKFAEDKQVVIFTCHPMHAKILGGNQITL